MTVIYIAGRFRGKSHWEIHQHVEAANALGLEVWRLGAVAIVPHKLTEHYQDALPDDVWLHGDLALLDRCDGLLTVDNWKDSVGAKAEVAHAITNGIPVFHSIGELGSWLGRSDQGDGCAADR